MGHDKLYRNIKHWRGEVGYIPGSSFFNAYLPKYKGHLKEPSGQGCKVPGTLLCLIEKKSKSIILIPRHPGANFLLSINHF